MSNPHQLLGVHRVPAYMSLICQLTFVSWPLRWAADLCLGFVWGLDLPPPIHLYVRGQMR